jgi:hypothetical protein
MLQSSSCIDVRLKKEITLNSAIVRGRSAGARLVQEYLWVNGIRPVIDGNWGDATQAALDQFCRAKKLPQANQVDQQLMDHLAQPLLRAASEVAISASLSKTIVKYAKQQLAEHPIEIGGENAGPWVRLYMNGNQGDEWLWCAGFVTYIVRHCAKQHQLTNPVPRTFSCDTLAANAKASSCLHTSNVLAAAQPGAVFLLPSEKSSADWVHTGLVLEANNGVIITAEGNTDRNGTSNGFEAVSRIRNAQNLHFVSVT